ncbi:MAG TPA: hypothetical protein V6C69_02995 [Trichormus sp.]|jgi:hypothetical protein
MINVPCTFQYNAKPVTMGLCVAVCCLCAWFFTNEALNNDRGAIIEHIITLDTGQATVMYWCFVGFMVIGVILAIFSLVRTFTNPKFVRLDADSVVLPYGFMQRLTARIPYSSIDNITETQVSRNRFLYLHTRSKKYPLMASLLPSKQIYEEIKAFLSQQIGT